MIPDNNDRAHLREQTRQNFRIWIGAGFTTSFLFISILLSQGQSTKDTASTVAVGAFLTAMVCFAIAFVWRETDSQAGISLLVLFYFGALSACIGLVNTVRHYDEMLGNYFLFIGALGVVTAWLLPSDASRQRKQAKVARAQQETPARSRVEP